MANPQSWNRYSYVTNRPINFNDPTGHKPSRDECLQDPNAPFVSLSKEHGLSIKHIGCTGGTDYFNNFWKPVVLPKIKRNIEKFVDTISFGDDTYEYWTGKEAINPIIGFGLDAAVKLIKDADNKTLTWDQRLTRAGIDGLEGATISKISASIATKSSQAVLAPSMRLAITIKHPVALAIPPVAVATTWAVSYLATNYALSYVADQMNENLPYIIP